MQELLQAEKLNELTYRLTPVGAAFTGIESWLGFGHLINHDYVLFLDQELALPPVKIHCSILAEDAIKAAINDYNYRCCKV